VPAFQREEGGGMSYIIIALASITAILVGLVLVTKVRRENNDEVIFRARREKRK
jgi:hypothetical protein